MNMSIYSDTESVACIAAWPKLLVTVDVLCNNFACYNFRKVRIFFHLLTVVGHVLLLCNIMAEQI